MDIRDDYISNLDEEVKELVNYIISFSGDDGKFKKYFEEHIKIKVSDKEKEKEYKGKNTEEEVRKTIDKTECLNGGANYLLEQLKKELSKPSIDRNISKINEIINELDQIAKSDRSSYFDKEKIGRIINGYKDVGFETNILGEYSNRKITLYRKSIIDDEKHGDINRNAKRVLIHEIFHAYHHYKFDGGKCTCSDFNTKGKAEIVKEGLARFVEYNYCKKNLNGVYCDDLKDSWNSHSFERYPYSAAKFLEEYSNKRNNEETKKAITKRLLKDSSINFEEAYYDIVYLYKIVEGFDTKLLNDESNINNIQHNMQMHFEEKKQYILTAIENNDVFKKSNNNTNNLSFLTVDEVKSTLSKNQKTFSNILIEMIEKKNMTDPECYKKAHMNKSAFNKIINGKTIPNRKSISLLSIALKLNSDEFDDFINAAGYGRSNDIMDPINIVGIYIDNKEYDLFDIELAVEEITGKPLSYYENN